MLLEKKVFIHPFDWHVQNVTIPCRSHQQLAFLHVIYVLLPLYFNYSSILPHFSLHLFLSLPVDLVLSKSIYNTVESQSIVPASFIFPYLPCAIFGPE
jgi:hypothetical protein